MALVETVVEGILISVVFWLVVNRILGVLGVVDWLFLEVGLLQVALPLLLVFEIPDLLVDVLQHLGGLILELVDRHAQFVDVLGDHHILCF